jgi:pimeloyl-ACP methyl ester carboxylesterase
MVVREAGRIPSGLPADDDRAAGADLERHARVLGAGEHAGSDRVTRPCEPRAMPTAGPLVALCLAAACAPSPVPAPGVAPAITRHDARIDRAPGVQIAVRVVTMPGARGVPVLLVHGAGGGGIASFDLPVPGYSLAEDLARAGHATYVMDVRGWGRSTRPAALDAPPEAQPPAVTSAEATQDIAAVAAWIRDREHRAIAVVGWATGGHWAGMYAAHHPEAVSHLVMLNAIYGTPGAWPLRARLEDPDHPGQLSPAIGAYALRDAASLLRPWDASIPLDDKAGWRDPRVAAAYAETAIASDPTSHTRTPPSVRVPSGPLADSYRLAGGAAMWDAAAVRAATLIVRSQRDFWSRPEDVVALRRGLVHARRLEVVELADATHLVFLDRPERGRARFVELVRTFLAQD